MTALFETHRYVLPTDRATYALAVRAIASQMGY